ncbi:SDR family oxidoreductase [Sphingomonas bisphenolicum]
MSLQDARILVVGGSSGIGLAVARAAISEGAIVTVASSNAAKVSAAAERLGARPAVLDVTDEHAVTEFFRNSDGFEHIVSTAGDAGGPGRRGSFSDMDLDQAQTLLNVRFWGAARLAKHGAKILTPGGSLTLTSGLIAFLPRKGTVVATAGAGAIGHLVYGLAVELAPLRVNGIFPGSIATEMMEGLPESVRHAEGARMAGLPIPRMGQPEEIAEAYLFVMKCGYVTGQLINVDGGAMLPG